MTTIYERNGCRVRLEIGDRIEYAIDGDGHRHVVSTPLAGLDTLTAYLAPDGTARPVDGTARLEDASRAAALRDGFERYAPGSIAAEVRRWCHHAGLPCTRSVDGRLTHREHIVATAPQPGTGRTVTLTVLFWTDELLFTEEYRGPAEVLGYSYTIGLRYDGLPRLADHVETLAGRRTTGAPEDRLVAALDELVAQGIINPLAGQGEVRELFASWCGECGAQYRLLGVDRRESLVQVPTRAEQVAEVSFTIGSSGKRLGFHESWGQDALYQLQFEYDELARLLPWLTDRAGPLDPRLGPDDALVTALR
ncbi:hypothetical protein, partial [Kribbella sp.]|uniref:hypothetical protein n=1 Tax=Kribbella sp. TaxID=1871183 RepID=UPI002D392C85